MNYLTQVQQGIDFIETNLEFELSLKDVARAACISQWHFQRIFKALTNETLKTYIRTRRLAKALEKLLHSDCRIIDIAITAGFESQESFTRAFKQAFQMTPNEARKIGDKNRFLKKIVFDSDYLKHINQNLSLTPEIVTFEEKHYVGMKTDFYSADSEKNNMGEKLPSLWNEFLPRMQEIRHLIDGAGYGIIQQPIAKGLPQESDKNNTSDDQEIYLEYYAVVEVSSLESIPKGMTSLSTAKASYAKFRHKGKPLEVNNTVNYIYSSWLMQSGKQHNYRHSYGADIEIYGNEYIPDSDESVIYYAIPIE